MRPRPALTALVFAALSAIPSAVRAEEAAADAEASLAAAAIKLHDSLTADQRTKAVLPLDDPAREQILFPGGPRAGIPLKELTADQRALAMKLLTMFTSEAGAKKAEQVATQDPGGSYDKYFLAFFGAPGAGKSYAWRIAEHHLTLVQVEVEQGKPASFGPILLGSNPPEFWGDEEDAMIALYAALTPEERKQAGREGKGESAKPIEGAGVTVGELCPASRERVKAVLENRLAFFAPFIRDRVRAMVEKQGGLSAMRVAFWGEATKRCKDGGFWDFKLGGPAFLCDYENTRKHIHLSMKGKL